MNLRGNGSSKPPPTQQCDNNVIPNGTEFEDFFEVPGVRYALVACYIAAILLSAAGNGYLMFYILRNRRRTKKNVTALLIFNLAFCDFIITLLTPLRLVDILMPKVSEADVYCKVGSFFSLFLASIAFLSIVAISCERLLLICFPLRAKAWLTFGNTVKVIAGSWIVSFFTALPLPILYTFLITVPLSDKAFTFCLINVFRDSCSYPGGGAYFLFLFITNFLIPVIVITICYSKIFHTLYCGAAVLKNTTDERQLRMVQTRKSLAKMMLFIAISFALLEGPYFFTFLFITIGFRIGNNKVFLLMIIEFLPMISAIINPLVYSVRTKTFKKSVSNPSGVHGESVRRNTYRSNSSDHTPIVKRQSNPGSIESRDRDADDQRIEVVGTTNGYRGDSSGQYITLNGGNEEPSGTFV